MAQLELAGVSTVVVCTTAFLKAADEQWEALGFPEGSVVAVAHPLGSMPLERVLAAAESAVDSVVARLMGAKSMSGEDDSRATS